MWRVVTWRASRCRLSPVIPSFKPFPRSAFSNTPSQPSDPSSTSSSTESAPSSADSSKTKTTPQAANTSSTTTSTSSTTTTGTSSSTGGTAFRPLKQTKLRMPEGFAPAESSVQPRRNLDDEEDEEQLGYQKPINANQTKKNKWNKYIKFAAYGSVAVLIFLNGAFIKKYMWKGTIGYLGWASEPTYVLSALSVGANLESDFTNFILLGGIPKLIHLAKTSPNEEARMGALIVLHTISATPFTRKEICLAYPEFVSELLNLVTDVNPANKPVVGAALNVMYNYLGDKQWFYEDFMRLKGFDTLIKCMKSTEPEIANFAGQLVGLFIMENREWFRTQKFKEPNLVFGALANMAAIYQDAGRSEYALKAYECIMYIDNKNPMILTQMGLEMLKVGREEEGISLLLKSLEINPKQLEAAFGLAKYTLKSPSDAKIKTAIDVLMQGLPELKRVNTAQFPDGKHPLAPKVYNFLVNLYLKIGDLEAALEMAQDWAAYAVADPNALATTGKILYLQKEYRDALEPLGSALRLNDRLPQAHLYRALCLASIKRDDLALIACQDGMQVETELRRAAEHRLHFARTRAEQAIKEAEFFAHDEKKMKEAERMIADAHRAERERPEVLAPLYLLAGKLFLKNKQYKEALGCYETVLLGDPSNVKAHLQKAQTLKLKREPASQVYAAYTTGFRLWLESETKKREQEKKLAESKDAKSLPPKKAVQKAKKGAKPDNLHGSKAILLKAYKRCQSVPKSQEGLQERTEMCKVVLDLANLLQLQSK